MAMYAGPMVHGPYSAACSTAGGQHSRSFAHVELHGMIAPHQAGVHVQRPERGKQFNYNYCITDAYRIATTQALATGTSTGVQPATPAVLLHACPTMFR